tara:strand:- start:812 stop:1222 length:411 start_codon:yes stop_codon:yes gene_type:complete
MKKTVYIITFDGDDTKHYRSKQQEVCNVLNHRLNTDRYHTGNIVHFIYRAKEKNRLGINIERVDRDDFLKKWVDAFMNTIKLTKYENYHPDHIKRLRNKYILMIEQVVLNCMNEGKDTDYIDKQVDLSHPLIPAIC